MNLETDRLIIRPWNISDVPNYMKMSLDVGYNCFTTPGVYLVKDEHHAGEKIQERINLFELIGLGKFPIFERKSGEFVGTCGGSEFELDGSVQVELGYRLMLDHWGKGYATEASDAVLFYLFKSLKISTVYGFAVPQNQGSIKVLEKLRFNYEKDFIWANFNHRLYKVEARNYL